MRVDSWFYGTAVEGPWLDTLTASHSYYSWPPAGSHEHEVLVSTWYRAFAVRNVSREAADEALLRLATETLDNRTNPLARFLAILDVVAREIRDKETAASGDCATREAAEAASRGCPDCGGCGVTSRHRHDAEAKHPAVSCLCVCPMGRWAAGELRDKQGETYRRMVDLNRHEWAWLRLGPVSWRSLPDNKHRYRRCEWDDAAGRPRVDLLAERDPDAAAEPLGLARTIRRDADDNAGARPLFAAPLPTPGPASVSAPAQAPAPVPSTEIPDASSPLTTSQRLFLADLGDHWRSRFDALSEAERRGILDQVREGFDNSHKLSAVKIIAAQSS